MKLIKFTLKSCLIERLFTKGLMVFFMVAFVPAFALSNKKENNSVASISIAKKIASNEYKKYTKNKIKKFSCKLLEENEKEWVFVYSDSLEIPKPGSDIFITVNKNSGGVRIYPSE